MRIQLCIPGQLSTSPPYVVVSQIPTRILEEWVLLVPFIKRHPTEISYYVNRQQDDRDSETRSTFRFRKTYCSHHFGRNDALEPKLYKGGSIVPKRSRTQ